MCELTFRVPETTFQLHLASSHVVDLLEENIQVDLMVEVLQSQNMGKFRRTVGYLQCGFPL